MTSIPSCGTCGRSVRKRSYSEKRVPLPYCKRTDPGAGPRHFFECTIKNRLHRRLGSSERESDIVADARTQLAVEDHGVEPAAPIARSRRRASSQPRQPTEATLLLVTDEIVENVYSPLQSSSDMRVAGPVAKKIIYN